MVIRENYRCETCNKKYTFRVSIGHLHEHYFTICCIECGLPITIKLILDMENVLAWTEPIENCINSTSEGQIVNINPGFLIPKKYLFSDHYFQHKDLITIGNKCDEFISKYCPHNLKDFYASFSYGRDLVKDYYNRKKIYHLVKNGRKDLAIDLQKKINLIFNHKFSQLPEINNLIDISLALLMPEYYNRFLLLKRFYRYIFKKYKSKDAKKYLRKKSDDHFYKFLLALDSFFMAYHELNKVSIYVRSGESIPEETTSASTNFDQIKKLYGDGFEIIMDLAVTPSILNNLYMGRYFNKFETMDLDKYLTIDKAGKMNPFKNNPKLSFLLDNVNSQIRNASHHNNISMEFGPTREKIVYKSGRPPRTFIIDYAKYLELCVKIYFDIFLLYAAERIFVHR